jgi:DNA primase
MNEADEIKGRIDIVDFITQYVEMKKAGINYSSCCPFHNEKTPSFMVSPERQSFRCFGCGEGGDVITFFQKIEGLSFPEALKILGERVGVEVRFSSRDKIDQNKNDKDRLFKINLLAAKFFKMSLQAEEGKLALKYLHDRGVKDEVIEKFKVGFAPNNDKLRRIFNSKEIHDADMSYAGHPERFRYRIMFPILDNFSQIIGFSGRILEDQIPANVSVHPKYLNTPETPVFHKSKALYGINLAKETIRKNKRVVIVEGQMDVLMSHQAGIEEVVASSGTALTEDHLKSLSRLAPNIIFSFDEDEAGIKAANSAIMMGLAMGLEIKLTTIEKYKDVGELVEAEPEAWKKIVDAALPPVEWFVSRATKGKESLSALEKKELARSVLSFIVRMKDEVEKAHYVQYLSKVVGVPPIAIEKSLNQIKIKPIEAEQVKQHKLNLEEYYLAFLMNYPKVVSKYQLAQKVNFEEKELEEIYKQLHECYNSKQIAECIKETKSKLSREITERLDAVCLVWDERFSESEDLAEEEFVSVKLRFEDREKEKIKDGFAKMISDAEISGDLEKVKELMKKLQESFKK